MHMHTTLFIMKTSLNSCHKARIVQQRCRKWLPQILKDTLLEAFGLGTALLMHLPCNCVAGMMLIFWAGRQQARRRHNPWACYRQLSCYCQPLACSPRSSVAKRCLQAASLREGRIAM